MAWECTRCHNFVVNHPSLCDLCGNPRVFDQSGLAGAPGGRPIAGARDLKTEAHLRAIAIWQRFGAAIVVGALTLLTLVRLSDVMSWEGPGKASAALWVLMPLVVTGAVCGVLFWIGRKLGQLTPTGRIGAGVACIVLGGLQILRVIAALVSGNGLALGAAVVGATFSCGWLAAQLVVLFSDKAARVCTPEYHEIVAERPDQEPAVYASPFFWIPFIGVALFCGLFFLGSMAASAASWR